MIFKQENPHLVTFVGFDAKPSTPFPTPKVGETYCGYDDGKISPMREVYWKITAEINLDDSATPVSLDTLDILQGEIQTYHWLYDKEQHTIYEAVEDAPKRPSKKREHCFFIKTYSDEWFGVGSYLSCLLDTDDRYHQNNKEEK